MRRTNTGPGVASARSHAALAAVGSAGTRTFMFGMVLMNAMSSDPWCVTPSTAAVMPP